MQSEIIGGMSTGFLFTILHSDCSGVTVKPAVGCGLWARARARAAGPRFQ